MTIATPVRAGVSLEELLAAKERRAARQAVTTRLTPGESIDVLVTDHGIAVTPRARRSASACWKPGSKLWISARFTSGRFP